LQWAEFLHSQLKACPHPVLQRVKHFVAGGAVREAHVHRADFALRRIVDIQIIGTLLAAYLADIGQRNHGRLAAEQCFEGLARRQPCRKLRGDLSAGIGDH
jgi:hypothetical protein